MIHKSNFSEHEQEAIASFGKFWNAVKEQGMPDNRAMHRLLRKTYINGYINGAFSVTLEVTSRAFDKISADIDEYMATGKLPKIKTK